MYDFQKGRDFSSLISLQSQDFDRRDGATIDRQVSEGWVNPNHAVSDMGKRAIAVALRVGVGYAREALFAHRELIRIEPINTLQADLLLVAKSHYGYEIPRLLAASIVCSQHVFVNLEHWDMGATLHWLLEEFVKPGLILTTPTEFTDFLRGAGRMPNDFMTYQATVATGLMDAISQLPKSKLPFELPSIDPKMAELLKRPAEQEPITTL